MSPMAVQRMKCLWKTGHPGPAKHLSTICTSFTQTAALRTLLPCTLMLITERV